MIKKLDEYETIVVDLDGTLCYQKPVRSMMVLEMMINFWRWSALVIVKKYRELYELGCHEAERLQQLPERAPCVIREWMIDRPLKYIKMFKDEELLAILQTAAMSKKKLIVYSDYPVREKLSALNFNPDYAFSAEDVGSLKPDPTGLWKKLRESKVNIERCLVIGDRYEKDGILAEKMGVDCIILPCAKTERRKLYKSLR